MAEKGRKEKTFTHEVGELVLVKWNDGMVYFAKIKRIDWRKRKCVVIFDDRSTDDALFSQIHSVDETTTDIICIKCKRDDSESPNEIVLCDSCGIGFHQKCHSPTIPASALELDNPWQCVYCLKNTRNPYLTESIDVMQILFEEGDDMEVDIKKEIEDEEEIRVKQEITSSDEDSVGYWSSQTSSISSLSTRNRKGKRGKKSTKSRPLQQLKQKLASASVNHENNSRKRRVKTDDESSGTELQVKRRISTVESHTVSVQNVPTPTSILNHQTDKLSEHETSISDGDDDMPFHQSGDQIGPPPKKKPRSLRVSLTLPPSVDTSPLVTPANKTASLTISPPPLSALSTLKTASEKLETAVDNFTALDLEQTSLMSDVSSNQQDTSEISSSALEDLPTVTDTVSPPIINQVEMQVDETIMESDKQQECDQLTTSVLNDMPKPTSSNEIVDLPKPTSSNDLPSSQKHYPILNNECDSVQMPESTGETKTKETEEESSQMVISSSQMVSNSITSPTSVTTTEPVVSQEKPGSSDNQSLVMVSPGVTHLKPKRSTVIQDATTPPSGPSPLECLKQQIKNLSTVNSTTHVGQTTCTSVSFSLPTTVMHSTGIVSSAPPLKSRSQHSRKPIAPSRTIPVSTTNVTPIRPRQRKNSHPQNMIIISPSPSPPNVPISSGIPQPPKLSHSGHQHVHHHVSTYNPTNYDDVAFSPEIIAATRSKMILQDTRNPEQRLTHLPVLKQTLPNKIFQQSQPRGLQTHTQPLHHRIEGAQTHTRPINYRNEGLVQPLHHRNEGGVRNNSRPIHHGNEVHTENSVYTRPRAGIYHKITKTHPKPSVDNRIVPVALTPTTINATGEAATVYTLVPTSRVTGSHIVNHSSYSPTSRSGIAVPMPHMQMTRKDVSPITSPVLRSQPTATPTPRVAPNDLYSPVNKSGVTYATTIPIQKNSKNTSIAPNAVPYYTIMEVQPSVESSTNYPTMHVPTLSTTKPYAVVSAIPTQANSLVTSGTWSPPPRSPPASLKIPPPGPKNISNVSSLPAVQFVKQTSRPVGQSENRGVNQLRQEATSELTQHLHFFSSKYKKDFDSLSEENLVGIFHDALRKFHNNSKKYEEYVRTLCEKKTRAPNAEVFSPMGTPVQVRRGVSKSPQTILMNQSSSQLPISPTTPSNVVYIPHPQSSAMSMPMPMPPRFQQLHSNTVSSGHSSIDVAPSKQRSYQVHTTGVFVPPPSEQSSDQHSASMLPIMNPQTQLNYVQAVGQTRTALQPQIAPQSKLKNSYLLTQPPGTPLKSGSILVRPISTSTAQPAVNTSLSQTILKPQETSEPKENKPSRVCARCGKDATYLCSGCHDEWYCGRECQLKAWDEHAEHCKS